MSKGTTAQLTIVGRLGRDPEIKDTQSGHTFARFSVGVTLGWGQREASHWIDVTVWGQKAAERVRDFLVKGSRVYVTGEFGVNKWDNQRGETQFSPTINASVWEPLDSKADKEKLGGGSVGSSSRDRDDRGGGANREDRRNPADDRDSGGGWGGGFADDLDDDVPF